MTSDEMLKDLRIVIGLISALLVLIGDRIVVAVQLENARTRIMILEHEVEQSQRDQNDLIMKIRDRQVKNEERITRLEDKQ